MKNYKFNKKLYAKFLPQIKKIIDKSIKNKRVLKKKNYRC